MKQILVSMLRRLWLLPLAEQMAFYRAVWRCRNSNKEFMASNPGYLPPPLWLLYESSGHASLQGYDSSGELIAAVLHKMIRNHAAPGALTVLDWGCGPARIIRHMRTLGPDMILFGSDYNPKSVKWLRETFTDMRFEQNGLEPPLPFEDGSLDVVYCLSVFTHLSARMHTAWINDVERVLKPGGIFIGSFHGEECRYLLLDSEKRLFDKGELVTRANVKEGSRLFCAYQPHPYLENILFQNFDVLQVTPNPVPGMAQTLWVVRKKS